MCSQPASVVHIGEPPPVHQYVLEAVAVAETVNLRRFSAVAVAVAAGVAVVAGVAGVAVVAVVAGFSRGSCGSCGSCGSWDGCDSCGSWGSWVSMAGEPPPVHQYTDQS